MKTLYLLTILLCCLPFANTCKAQYCGGSGQFVCTPGGPYPALGLYPRYDSLPCAIQNTYYEQKVDMQVPTTIMAQGQTITIDSIKIDTIRNLPCGICWKSDALRNVFAGNSTHCILLSGIAFGSSGQYNTHIVLDIYGTNSGNPVTLSKVNASDFGIKFFTRVVIPGDSCVSIDTLSPGNTASTPDTIAPIVVSGTKAICFGGSTTLSIAGTYQAYMWSSGETTQTLTTSVPGHYTVTVYDHCNTATAAINITQTVLNANITSTGPTGFCKGETDTLVAGAGFTYLWSNGDTTRRIVVTETGSYKCTVSKSGCSATSNTINIAVTDASTNITAYGPTTFCVTDSLLLNAGAGFANYLWSDGDSTQMKTVRQSGTYTVTVSLNGCTGADSIQLTAANNLAPVITATDTTVCPGGRSTINVGIGYKTYLWSTGETTSDITVKPDSNTTYSVSVTQGTCSGSAIFTVQLGNIPVSVDINPSGPVSACKGDHVLLDAGSMHDKYVWSTGDSTQTILIDTSGFYLITVTNNACYGYDTVQVIVNDLPVPQIYPGGTQSICEGGSVQLNTDTVFENYTWSNGDTMAGITTTMPGIYTITVTKNGCSGSSLTGDTVSVNQKPVAAIDTLVYGWLNGNDLLTADTTGAATYQWLYNNFDTIHLVTTGNGDDSLIFECIHQGYYAVAISNIYGCTDTSAFLFVYECEGIDEIRNLHNFSVNPNPAKDMLSVSYNLEKTADVKINIADITGRILFTMFNETLNAGAYKHQIPVEGLLPGVYILNFTSQNVSAGIRLIKQ